MDMDKILDELESESYDVEPTKPTGKREVVENSIADATTGFKDAFTMDPVESIGAIVDKSIPRGIREEYNVIKEAKNEVAAIYNDNIKDLKGSAKETVDMIRMRTPDNAIYKNILNKISKSLDSGEDTSTTNREPTQDEIISGKLENLFNKDAKRTTVENVMREVKENNKFATSVSILTDILGNLKYGNQFREQVVEKYYRKSLELQYKSLYVNKQQVELSKSGYDTFKTQLEAIVKNTGLPDIVKIRKSEQLKENIQHRFRENVTDAFYSEANPLHSMKNNILNNIGKFAKGTVSGIKTGNMFMSQYNEMASMSGGPTKSEMIGAEIGNKAKDYIGGEIGSLAEKNDFIRDKLYKAKMGMVDPRETLFNLADKQYDKGTSAGLLSSKLLKMLGSVTNQDGEDFTRYGEGDPNEASVFDNRVKNSIVKIIPTILTKIYNVIEKIRTGKEDVEGIYYDQDTGKIQKESFIKEGILRDTSVALSGAAGGNLDRFTSLLEDNSGKEYTNDERQHIKSVILGHLVKNGSMSPEAMLKEDFLEQFDPEFRDLVKSSIEGTIENSKSDLSILDQFKDTLASTKNNIPAMDKQIEQYYKNGQIETLAKMGLVNYDPLRKEYKLNRDKYVDILKESISYKLDTENEVSDTLLDSVNSEKPEKLIQNAVKDLDRDKKENKTNDKPSTTNNDVKTDVQDSEPVVKYLKTAENSKLETIRRVIKEETERIVPSIKEAQIKSKVEKLNTKIKSIDIKDVLSKANVAPEEMYEKFQDSGSSHEGHNIFTWASSLGFKFKSGVFTKDDVSYKSDSIRSSILDRVKDNFNNATEMDKATGERKFTVNSVLNKTREWDRTTFKSIPSAITNSLVGTLGVAGKTLQAGKKYVGHANEAYGDSVDNGILRKTRDLEKNILKGTPKSVMDASKANVAMVAKAIEAALGKSKKKKVFGDSDGDGDRDNGWKDILSRKKKKVDDNGAVIPTKKEIKESGILGSIWGMLKGSLPFLGTIAGLGGKLLGSLGSLLPGLAKAGVAVAGAGVQGVKAGISALSGTAAVSGVVSKKPTKGMGSKIMTKLKSFKGLILKKLGKTAGAKMLAKLSAKIASRLVPGVGQALLAYDASMIARYMIGGLALTGAISKQILGFDITDDDDAVVDENGEPIKPDVVEIPDTENKDITVKENKSKTIMEKARNKVADYAETGEKTLNGVMDKTDNFIKTGKFKASPGKKEIMAILEQAGKRVGVDVNTLKTFAAMESSMNPNATSSTTSAKGLFQFTDSKWKYMLDKYGKKYGISPMTDQYDPVANALMGAALIKENKSKLKDYTNNSGITDLYLTQMLGAEGASKFLNSKSDVFSASVAPLLAKEHRELFFDSTGKPLTVGSTYRMLQNSIESKAREFGYKEDVNPMLRTLNKVTSTINNANSIKAPMKPSNNINAIKTAKMNVINNSINGGEDNLDAILNKETYVNKVRTMSENDMNITSQGSGIDYTSKLNSVTSILTDSYNVQVDMNKKLGSILDYVKGKSDTPVREEKIKERPVNVENPTPAVNLMKKRYH